MAIGVIAILVFAFILIGYVLFISTPDIKAEIGAVPVSAAAAESFSDKYTNFETEIEEAVDNKVKKEVTVTFTAEEVNSKIVELTAEGKFPFKEMLISFRPDACWLYFETDALVSNAKIGMIVKPYIENGNVKVEMLDFHVGKLPLPKSIDQSASEFVNVIVNMESPANNLPVIFTSVVTGDQTFTITGMTRSSD
jgi:uncharacterized protein YpmS